MISKQDKTWKCYSIFHSGNGIHERNSEPPNFSKIIEMFQRPAELGAIYVKVHYGNGLNEKLSKLPSKIVAIYIINEGRTWKF
jgi:hypothetical protein